MSAPLIVAQESVTELSTSVLQAFLRTSPGIAPRACGRRCLAGNHLRTWCPPNKPAGLGSGLGNPGSNPGGATRCPRLRPPYAPQAAACLSVATTCGYVIFDIACCPDGSGREAPRLASRPDQDASLF